MLAATESLALCSSHFNCQAACCRLLEIAKVFHDATAKQTLAQQAGKSQAALQASPCAVENGCQSAGRACGGRLLQHRVATTCRHSCKPANAETQPKPHDIAKPSQACRVMLATSLCKLRRPAEAAATPEAVKYIHYKPCHCMQVSAGKKAVRVYSGGSASAGDVQKLLRAHKLAFYASCELQTYRQRQQGRKRSQGPADEDADSPSSARRPASTFLKIW